MYPAHVDIKEVGPRDGLQNESAFIQTANKVALVNALSETGLRYIEVSSFVNPKWIPQLADAADVLAQIKREQDVTYAALVPNMHGLERALQVGVDEVSVFMSASEGHNQANINKSIAQTFPILQPVIDEALRAGKTVRGYISTVIACPIDGPTKPEQVRFVADRLFSLGVSEISLGDTIGVGVPTHVNALLSDLTKHFTPNQLAMHFHDTRGTALANIVESMQHGITKFDSAIGGLGGCPYAKGASGNVATEDLLYLLHEMGIETGVDLHKMQQAALFMERLLQKPLHSKLAAIARGNEA